MLKFMHFSKSEVKVWGVETVDVSSSRLVWRPETGAELLWTVHNIKAHQKCILIVLAVSEDSDL